jgi:hypothetical protein
MTRRFQDQARDRAGANRCGLQGRASAWRGADGRGLWLQYRVARRNRRAVVALCRRHHAAHDRVGMGHGAATAQKMVRQRTATQAHPPGRKASPGLGQGACAGIAKRAWRTINWREGTSDVLSSRFARVRVRAAHRDSRGVRRLLVGWSMAWDRFIGV